MQIECPICESKNCSTLIKISDKSLSKYNEYSVKYYGGILNDWYPSLKPEIIYCKSCHHHFYKYIPSDLQLSQMYQSIVRKHKSPPPDREPSVQMINYMKKLSKIIRCNKKRFLDYGAGYGRWSVAALKAGFEVYSFEPHDSRKVYKNGITYVNEYEDLLNIQFDFIWLEQVLEHVNYPYDTLSKLRDLMGSDTVLSLSVPNLDKFLFKNRLWKKWPYDGRKSHIMAPYQHLHGFTNRSLNALCKRIGFVNYNKKHMYKYYPIHTLRLSIGNYIPILSTTRRILNIK